LRRLDLIAFQKDVTALKELVRQNQKTKYFNEKNPDHLQDLDSRLKKWGKKVPEFPEIPYKWIEAFTGWNYLAKYGRPSAMGLMPHSFETILQYVTRLDIAKKHELELCDQIITIDIEFVRSTQKEK